MNIRYVDAVAHEPKEEFVCIRKLSTSKTFEEIMNELESVFVEKRIDKTKIRFSGLDGTNAMSGERKGLQRRIRHVSPFAVYMNCRNHCLALCLVHLLKSYSELESLDKLLLWLWKLLEYSSVKQAVFENAQNVDDLKLLKILKACTTRWLAHGETSARVISRYKQVIAALDALTNEKGDEDAKGIRDQLLSPTSILMLLLLAEVLVPINSFCCFLQTRNSNYSLIMSKFQRVVTKLEKIKMNLQNHDAIDVNLYFYLANDLLKFSEISMSKAKSLRSRDDQHSPTDQTIIRFITEVGEPFVKDLIIEIEDAMKETSPVLSGFDLFNPDAVDKSKQNRMDLLKTLCDHYGTSINDSYEGQTTTAAPVINPVHAKSEFEDFMEAFDDAVSFLNEKFKKSAKQLVGENKDSET